MEKTEKRIDIPEDIQNVCREFATLARKLNVRSFSARFSPPFENGWNGEVSFSWEQGRHGDDANIIKITSNFYVHTTVNQKS